MSERPASAVQMAVESPEVRVVATAGHVDHGKSTLILRLTGMDPDRLAEEKRRGLTIDLGFAWGLLPSGREVGFVDVPGHERFIRNMLAGVGPVRLVLFVVAADEGWKPQSEEHLEIVDVLGATAGVVALTKRDLVDAEKLQARIEEISSRLSGTRLAHAPIVPCSSITGEGLDELRQALDLMLREAPPPEERGRPRQFIDRVFTIRGAGTVVTGTLTGGPLSAGMEAEVLPTGHRARIRGLQTHKRTLQVARPVSRVAVNLAGTATADLERGDALTVAGQWRATSLFEGLIVPVRGLDHPLTSRGAYKVYAGSAERDAVIRLLGVKEIMPGHQAYARVQLNRPLVLDFRDPFVVREAGRRQTVAGGEILDTSPPPHPGSDFALRLDARSQADRRQLAQLIVSERGAVRAADAQMVAGVPPEEAVARGVLRLGSWLAAPDFMGEVGRSLVEALAAYHQEHPLRPGLEVVEARALLAEIRPILSDSSLADIVLEHLASRGRLSRHGTIVSLPDYQASTAGRHDADRLVAAVEAAEPTPPSVKQLMGAGFDLELINAVCADGRLVRVSQDVLVSPALLGRAEAVVRERAVPPGLTVSAFREALGTSRRLALPMLEYFDGRGLTRRQGDVRLLRGGAPR